MLLFNKEEKKKKKEMLIKYFSDVLAVKSLFFCIFSSCQHETLKGIRS